MSGNGLKWLGVGIGLFLALGFGVAEALPAAQDTQIYFDPQRTSLSQVGGHVETQVNALTRIIALVCYLAGLALAWTGLVQFKVHRDQPVQTPISKPITILFVGAGLLFLPTLMDISGATLFGKNPIKTNRLDYLADPNP